MSTPNLFSLAGRVALVTGSSRGIGRAIAGGYADAGALVVVNGRKAEAVDRTVAELRAAGANAHPSVFDVTDPEAVAVAVEAIETEVGPIDILVNNAGMQYRAPLEDFPVEQWQRLMRTNIDSLFYVGQAVARKMIPRRRGAIVNICSIQTALARPTIAPYTASKGAAGNLTKGMCADWANYGLRINGLAPGYFSTELNKALMDNAAFNAWLVKRVPTGRWGEVGELIGAAVFLASDAASYVNGHILYVDGGVSAVL
ncbi:MAG: SDR family oxidoreductase [Cucumibacter sp.]